MQQFQDVQKKNLNPYSPKDDPQSSSTTRYKQKEIEQTINIPFNQDVKQRMKDYLKQRNYAQEQLEKEKLALQLQLQTQQLELLALKNQQVLEEQTKKTTIGNY